MLDAPEEVRIYVPLCASCGCPPFTHRRRDCEHDSADGIDSTPLSAADKVWRCLICDALFRFESHDGISFIVPLCGCGRCSGWVRGKFGWWTTTRVRV